MSCKGYCNINSNTGISATYYFSDRYCPVCRIWASKSFECTCCNGSLTDLKKRIKKKKKKIKWLEYFV